MEQTPDSKVPEKSVGPPQKGKNLPIKMGAVIVVIIVIAAAGLLIIFSGSSHPIPGINETLVKELTPAGNVTDNQTIVMEVPTASIPDKISPTEENIEESKNIAEEYHKTHTYIGNDIFVCYDMASDVWNILETKGINANIVIGNIESLSGKSSGLTHAWVMAETTPGFWTAVESTGGIIVRNNTDYYSGYGFPSPLKLKEYNKLIDQYNSQYILYKDSITQYNWLVSRVNAERDPSTKISLNIQLNAQGQVVSERSSDLDVTNRKIKSLLVYYKYPLDPFRKHKPSELLNRSALDPNYKGKYQRGLVAIRDDIWYGLDGAAIINNLYEGQYEILYVTKDSSEKGWRASGNKTHTFVDYFSIEADYPSVSSEKVDFNRM